MKNQMKSESPKHPNEGFICLLENQEPHGLPQETHVTTSSNKTKMGEQNNIKDLAPLSPSLVESYPPIYIPCPSCNQRCILLIYIEWLHFLSTLAPFQLYRLTSLSHNYVICFSHVDQNQGCYKRKEDCWNCEYV
jgi:hypothetical protein